MAARATVAARAAKMVFMEVLIVKALRFITSFNAETVPPFRLCDSNADPRQVVALKEALVAWTRHDRNPSNR